MSLVKIAKTVTNHITSLLIPLWWSKTHPNCISHLDQPAESSLWVRLPAEQLQRLQSGRGQAYSRTAEPDELLTPSLTISTTVLSLLPSVQPQTCKTPQYVGQYLPWMSGEIHSSRSTPQRPTPNMQDSVLAMNVGQNTQLLNQNLGSNSQKNSKVLANFLLWLSWPS